MRSRFVRFVACTAALMTLAIVAHANLRYRRAFVTKYPEVANTRLAECITCHRGTAQMPALNPYGAAFKAAHYTFDDLEKLDSDKDGASNRKEIQALSYPGDPNDKPGKKAPAKPDSSAAPDSARAKPDSTTTDSSASAPDTTKQR